MADWVALLRGVNVGGANTVPMAELRALAEGLGWANVRSYIASGNLLFEAQAGDHAETLRAAMVAQMGVDVAIRVLAGHEIDAAAAACPWDVKGNLVHVFFCWDRPVIDGALRDALIAPDEELVVQGNRVWLYAPCHAGFGLRGGASLVLSFDPRSQAAQVRCHQ